MDKDLIRGVILVFLTCISFASLVSSNENKKTVTRCSDGLGLNYTLPMFNECKKKLHSNGSMVQTIPKLIPYSSAEAACPRRKSKLGIPPGHRVCRFPDCGENTCGQNGWCEETMKNFKCHCSAGYRGKRCNKQSTTAQDTTTMSTTEPTTTPPATTTESTTAQDTTTMSTTEPTNSHPATTTESTTTQDTTTLSTTEPTTSHPAITTESTTTQDTTTMSTTEPTTSHPAITTASTTSREATTNSISDSTTPNTTTTTTSTAKIFVTDGNGIFVADLQGDLDFISIPSSNKPRYITYDSVEKKIYWTDHEKQRVYCADADGGNREEVTSENENAPRGIAIAESSRILYILYVGVSREIRTVDIGQGSAFPGDEANFVTELFQDIYSLEVDEEQGFLYWSMGGEILRKPLNRSGSTETVYSNSGLSDITGLSIDLSRDPRRIFVCDFGKKKTFYKEVNQNLTSAHDLTDYMQTYPDINVDNEWKQRGDVSYFDGTLYWVKRDSPSAIAVMTNYDQSSRSFDIEESLELNQPFQLLIINVNP